MISGEEYRERLKEHKKEIYVKGEKVGYDHPNVKPVVNAIAYTYDLAKEMGGVHSDLINGKVNVLNAVIKSFEQLVFRYEFQKELSHRLATCNYRCTGCDAINSLAAGLNDKGRKKLFEFLKEVQKNDLACTASLTDSKGDRSKRPSEQKEQYVRVVDEQRDGIVVSGAKIHQSGAFASEINFVLPGQTFKKGEEEFAVAFALTPEDKGVSYVVQNTGYQALQREGADAGNPKYGDRITCVVIMDEVFVPWERVFIYKDLRATASVLQNFANSHRCVGAACKAEFLASMAGAASLMLKANGLENVSVLRQKVAEIVGLSEAAFAISIGAAYKGEKVGEAYVPNAIMANSAKVAGVDSFMKAIGILTDISGALPATSPSEEDLKAEGIGEKLRTILKASEKFSPEERLKIAKFVSFWLSSSHVFGAVHGGGSPSAALIFLQYLADFERYEKPVKDILS
ncbi:Vinylacetyl-CoA Delta-isomerase [Ferroglobus placidus DSM 10642]|uniref:Vinylacetyl-CoA Delta-isomerase n=1 Tax=Ferroglobus placidus (strain DSM 10642 / AEDII12DO) TaxID=589924 RepID=D3RX64_FERPA|nr:4-hydroxyphenylacetate 3-hydroxylase N-terminal domain-containing protein [Ferroglobus placidus]ADC65077.1 Vinylacetyl-CoA Delta-isomerase [Ferroglobus placidus DSM 10642]